MVSADITDDAALVADAPRAGAEVTMRPPDAICTLASGEVVVNAWPSELVPLMTAAGTRDDVVIVLPCALVVVTATSMLVGAVDSKAEVVIATELPAEFVVDITTGTRTPLAVPALEPALTVPAVMAAGVLTIVLPAWFVVVTGDGVLAAIVDCATIDVTRVLPASFVVVMATVVPP